MNKEARVGLLFFIGIGLMLGFTLFVTDIGRGKGDFHIRFPKVTGLSVGAAVHYNGIPVGQVTSIEPVLDETGQPSVLVGFTLDTDNPRAVVIGPESRFTISQNMLGGGALAIEHQGRGQLFSTEALKGMQGEAPTTFNQALEQLGEVIGENRASLGTAVQKMPEAVDNLAGMAAEIRDTVAENREAVAQAIASVRRLATAYAQLAEDNRREVASAIQRIDALAEQLSGLVSDNRADIRAAIAKLPELAANLSAAGAEIKAMVAENRLHMRETLGALAQFAPRLDGIGEDVAAVTAQLRSGHGTLGRLIFDESLHEKTSEAVDSLGQRLEEVKPLTSGLSSLKFYTGLQTGVDVEHGNSTSLAYLRIEPKPWKFYEGGVGWRTAPSDREVADEDPDDLNVDFHLAFGYRFFRDDDAQAYRLSVKGGLLEGALGGQLDYLLWRDRLTSSLLLRQKHDDFPENDRRFEEGDGPMGRLTLQYRIWRRVNLIAGATDLFDDPSPFIGIGGELLDNDIRNLTTATGILP